MSKPRTLATQTPERGPILGGPLLVLTISIGLYLLANSAQVRLSVTVEVMFALFACVTAILTLAGILGRRRLPMLGGALTAWALTMCLALVQLPFSAHAQPVQGVVDFGVMILPAILTLAVGLWIQSRRQLTNLLILVTIISFISSVAAWATSTSGSRYAAPPVIAIVGAWVLATARIPDGVIFARHPSLVRLVSLFACFALLIITLGSRQRTALAVWFLCAIIAIIFVGVKHTSWKLLIIMAFGALLVLFWRGTINLGNQYATFIEQARLETIASGQYIQAGGDRLREVSDIHTTMQNEASPLDYAVGFGHGATYPINLSYGGENLNADTGRGHQIHIVPVMVFFRYGLVGLAILVWLICGVLKQIVSSFREEKNFLTLFLLLGLLMYIIDMMARNAFVDPGFALIIATVCVYPQIDRLRGHKHPCGSVAAHDRYT